MALDAKTILERELKRRCEANPRYSMRAFAQGLGVSHTALSLILSGARPPSRKMVALISERLGLSPQEKWELLISRATGEVSKGEVLQFDQISLDQFELLSDWYHYAILSLLELPKTKFEAKWLAKRLNISETQAKLSIDLLKRLNLVEEATRGRWRQRGGPIKVENNVSTSATRKHHRQLLERAIHSLENDPFELRDFSAMTFVMDVKSIPYAKERIRSFRRELMQELETRGRPDEVYRLAVQIYPVTRPLTKKEPSV